jgi:hypothetical protein
MKAVRHKLSKLFFLTRDGEGSCRRGRSVRKHDPVYGPVRQPKAGDRTSEARCITDSMGRATSRYPFNGNKDMGKCGLKPIPPNEIFGAIGLVRKVLGHNRTAAM